MATDGRHKTSKKNESVRLTNRHNDKDHPNEYGYLRDDINALWTSWAMTSGTSDMWRRIEQNGIDAAIKKVGKCRSDLTVISRGDIHFSISSDDAINIMGVMIEFTEMLNSIRLAFEENEQDIFDNDERESRYLTETSPAILELWSNYTTFAAEFAFNFVQRSWHNSSEHRELLASVGEVLASSTKLLVVAVNMGDYHSLEDADTLRSISIRETTTVSKDLENNLNKIYKLEASDSSFEDYKDLMAAITSLTDTLRQRWGNKQEENEKEQQLQVQPSHQDRKASKVDNTPPVIETKQPREEYLEVVQKLKTVYSDFSNDAWETRRLPVMRGTGGVQMQYRMESYEQIRKFRVNACAVHKRKELLDSLSLTSDYDIHSELFVVEPDGLACDHEFVISFPLTSSKAASSKDDPIFIKLRVNGEWNDAEDIKKEKLGNQTIITFNSKSVEAFTSMSLTPRDALIVGPSGANYISEDSGKVEMTIPQDCYTSEVTLGIKTIPFDKRGYDTTFMGIVTASVAVEVSQETGESTMSKHIALHVSLEEAEGDTERDTEIVVVRCNDQYVQVLDKKQISLKENANNQYSVDVKGYWCVAVLRIRRIYLNMRESIKREFLIGYGIKTPCNIVTFIDDVTRQTEKQTLVMEIIEKCDVDMAVDIKRGFGLIEVKKSRSRDILLKRGDQVAMLVDGQLRITEAISDNQNILSYLKGGRNTVFMPTEIKRDPEKLPDAMIFYKLVQEDSVLHSVAIMTRDLSELSTDAIIARTGLNMNVSDSKQDKQKEEAAVQILKMESLMSLARELTFEEGTSLGQQLGVKPETIKKISQNVEKDHVSANFQILCSWRGRCARATMADFLVSCLKAVGKLNYADLVMEVRTHNRGLERSDFTRMKAVQSGKSF